MSYGWQIFDSAGAILYDNSVVMSRVLGSLDVDIITSNLAAWSKTISGIAFNGGTPFAFCVARSGLTVPTGVEYAYIPPQIYCGSDYVTISYNDRILSYPDDLSDGLAGGGLTVIWGVYNG